MGEAGFTGFDLKSQQSVPEPTMVLGLLGLAGGGLLKRKLAAA
ncbi:MAG: PEP-CTERM sorting domain-containing protein [Synechococcales cyanobacterium RM1_1_8]|nr:PEP-CTERM sorting domain-containing protein [Synechococcales cyanobacterium RM1_1_8]